MKKYRDNFINSSYSFSLLISKKSNLLLQKLFRDYKEFQDRQVKGDKDQNKIEESKVIFKKTQNDFINSLRKEFSIQEDIEFETYAITLPGEP